MLRDIRVRSVSACLLVVFASFSAAAETVVLTTAQSLFDDGTLNQGWWSDSNFATDSNDNYVTGRLGNVNGSFYRSFFTFDLSSLQTPVSGATLSVVRRFESSADPVERLGLFDVTTDAQTLNNNLGIDLAIFDDLGSGAIYGTFLVDMLPCCDHGDEILDFILNENAVADINAASGGWFSVGGALLDFRSPPPTPTSSEAIFQLSQGYVTRLSLIMVPEPSTAHLITPGLALLLIKRRHNRLAHSSGTPKRS